MKQDSRSGPNLFSSKGGAIINRKKAESSSLQRGTRLHLAGQNLAMGRDDWVLNKSDWIVLLVCSHVIQMESRK